MVTILIVGGSRLNTVVIAVNRFVLILNIVFLFIVCGNRLQISLLVILRMVSILLLEGFSFLVPLLLLVASPRLELAQLFNSHTVGFPQIGEDVALRLIVDC